MAGGDLEDGAEPGRSFGSSAGTERRSGRPVAECRLGAHARGLGRRRIAHERPIEGTVPGPSWKVASRDAEALVRQCPHCSLAWEAAATVHIGPVAHFVSMKKGGVSTGGRWFRGRDLARVGGVERCSCLYGLLGGRIRRNWMLRSRAQVQQGGQAARRKAAPLGANSWLRESMCQIAWLSRRAMSTWATLAPRCLPSRRLLRW